VKRTALITLILGTVLALAPAAHAVVMTDGSPSDDGIVISTDVLGGNGAPNGISPAEYQALAIRGEALNQRYGNAITRLSSPEFKAAVESGLSPQEFVASVERGEGLNNWPGNVTTTQTPAATDHSSFAWGDTALAASTLAGVMLLAVASLAVTRRRKHGFSF
jgi:LPXTG-motif cell wall-anchored protein